VNDVSADRTATRSYDAGMLDAMTESARARAAAIAGDEHLIRERARAAPVARDFAGSLIGPGLSVIAEIKRRSPSVGPIAPDLDAGRRAASYRQGGAAAVSVLTDPDHFGALPGDVAAARQSGLPVLRKDFVVEVVQVWESRAMGADAVLLIVAILEQRMLERLIGEAADAGLAVLVEAHDETEVSRALDAGATVVGVNNRDLRTFEVDLGTAERLAGLLGPAVVRVAESGVASLEGAARMAAAGYHAILVGEAAVRSTDPAGLIASLREAG
jgi:indole-3-glycerol phosphate synthase